MTPALQCDVESIANFGARTHLALWLTPCAPGGPTAAMAISGSGLRKT